ncbi:MAG: hypothetical protein ABIK64_03480, partial [Bacillota bacterium]
MKKPVLIILLVVLLLCVSPPAASAADATGVWVNNVQLTAASPYWKNGNAPASASDWNAYFNAASATLTLQNAQIDTLSSTAVNSSNRALVYANGDLTLELSGTNTLQYAATSTVTVNGVYAAGSLAVQGSGSAGIAINLGAATIDTRGIYAAGNIECRGGTLDIRITTGSTAQGLMSTNNTLYSGGQAAIQVKGRSGRIVNCPGGEFRMTGGTIDATAESTGANALGLLGLNVSLEGGEGSFRAYGVNLCYGLDYLSSNISISGGRFVFSGDTSAIYCGMYGSKPPVNTAGVYIYVSESADGSGLRSWTSSADGDLVSDSGFTSPFRYVLFTAVPIGAAQPQTGDGRLPWLWSGIALCALLFAA